MSANAEAPVRRRRQQRRHHPPPSGTMSQKNTPSIVIAMPGDETIAAALAERVGARTAALEYRRFPDGESYLRMEDSLEGRLAVLVAPYLPYMRQDTRFHPGEALTSANFARWISERFDWRVTVDPHLHRHDSLDEIYSIPSTPGRE